MSADGIANPTEWIAGARRRPHRILRACSAPSPAISNGVSRRRAPMGWTGSTLKLSPETLVAWTSLPGKTYRRCRWRATGGCDDRRRVESGPSCRSTTIGGVRCVGSDPAEFPGRADPR